MNATTRMPHGGLSQSIWRGCDVMKSISVRQLEEALVKAFEAQDVYINEDGGEIAALFPIDDCTQIEKININQMAIDIERELS